MSILRFQSGQFSEDMIPTVGFNMRKITKGNVTIKVGNCVKQFEIEKKRKENYFRCNGYHIYSVFKKGLFSSKTIFSFETISKI